MAKLELNEEILKAVSGGSIDLLPDSKDADTGKIGLNNNFTHRYYSAADVNAYIKAHENDEEWKSTQEKENYLFEGMILDGIIYK